MKRIIVLGGDGFCGWPTALHLSRLGNDVTIFDNFSRRKIDIDLGIESLTPIAPMETRLAAWKQCSGHEIGFEFIDIAAEYDRFLSLIKQIKPDTIIHFAEQRAAPYSMRNARCKRYTVNNNLVGTHNVLCAIVESGLDIHLVHLGSMGVYGYESVGLTIPEGYIDARLSDGKGNFVDRKIMYPAGPGSVYHMTKTQDSLFFQYYNKNDGVRITDLHQGIVWGTSTEETKMHPALVNRFDYDGDYGTVLNRFLVQSVMGHPLTVYGVGGQSRAFIHIQNTVQCLALAVNNPPAHNEPVKVFNQATEVCSVLDLARKVAEISKAEIRYYADPRKEAPRNSLSVDTTGFRELGLNAITLSDGLLQEVRDTVKGNTHRCNPVKFICTSLWTKNQTVDFQGVAENTADSSPE